MSAAPYALQDDYAGDDLDLQFPPLDTDEARARRLRAMSVPVASDVAPVQPPPSGIPVSPDGQPAQWWRDISAGPEQAASPEQGPFVAPPTSQDAAQSAPPALLPGYESTHSALEEALGNRPVETSPKWWQRGLGAVAGGLAGWSNAASRTRNPINIDEMREEVLHPGYAGKLQEWTSRVAPLEAQAELEAKKQEAWWKGRGLNTEEQLKSAQAQMDKQHGEYWVHRAQMEQNQWKIDPKSGTLYNTITGEHSAPPQGPKDRYDTAKALGASEEEARYFALQGNMQGFKEPPAEKPRNLVNVAPGHSVYDPDSGRAVYTAPGKPEGGEKPPSRQQMGMVETRKQNALAEAEEEAQLRIKGGSNKYPEKEDYWTVMDDLAKKKQRIQEAYEAEISAATDRDTPHYEYPKLKPSPTAPEKSATTTQQPGLWDRVRSMAGGGQQAPKSAAAPQRYTEVQVRQAAIAKGKDPEAAVAIARQRGAIQ